MSNYTKTNLFLIPTLLLILLSACTEDEIVSPDPEGPFPVAGQIIIADGQKYTGSTTVLVSVIGADADSALVWTGLPSIPEIITWYPMPGDSLTIADFQLPNTEGVHAVHVLFSGEEKGLSEVFSDSIIVDMSSPSEAPAPIYPTNGSTGIPSVLAISWEAGVDQWCSEEELTYVVYGGDSNPPTELLYEGGSRFVPIGNLALTSSYYWQVTVIDRVGLETTGEVQTFSTWNASIPEFVLAPAGSYIMGSPESEWGRSSTEIQHEVTITRPFYMATTEFTHGDLLAAMQWAYENGYVSVDEFGSYDISGSEPYLFDEFSEHASRLLFDGGRFVHNPLWPAERILDWVNWEEATIICDWLNFQAGLDPLYQRGEDWLCNGGDVYAADGFRLATEAEWEYCCRAGTSTAFANGDISENECWDPVLYEIGFYCGNFYEFERLAAQKIPNDWGIYDMHGGLSEWMYDWDGDYPLHAVTDPITVKSRNWRSLRSGFATMPSPNRQMRSGSRGHLPPTAVRADCGLRIVRSFGNVGTQ